MNLFYLIVPLLIVFLGLIGYAVWWSNKRGLFNDLQGPRHWCAQQHEDRMQGVSRHPPRNQRY